MTDPLPDPSAGPTVPQPGAPPPDPPATGTATAEAGNAGNADGGQGHGGNGRDKTGLSSAVIGAAGVVVAAIVGGVFGLIVAFHHSGPTPHNNGPTPTTPARGLPVTVLYEQWLSPVNGERTIRVTGTVRNLPLGVAVIALAGPHPRSRPYYMSGPASMRGNDTWQALIQGIPATDLSLTFWPGETQLPEGQACSPACRSAAFARVKQAVTFAGPDARLLRLVGQPVRSHA